MGTYITSYAVRAKDLEKAIGSNDNHLYEECLKLLYSDDAESALKDLIFNQSNHSDELYVFAVEALCSYYGEELNYSGDFKFGHGTDEVDEVLKSDFGLDICIITTIFNCECQDVSCGLLPTELPGFPDGDMIGCGRLYRNDLLALQSQFKKIQITDDLLKTLKGFENESKDDELTYRAKKAIAYPLIKDIKEHISYCIEGSFDLFSFYG